jgi:hypothetical protein
MYASMFGVDGDKMMMIFNSKTKTWNERKEEDKRSFCIYGQAAG